MGRVIGSENFECDRGAPFDLEAAPNLARFVSVAELDWPLKDA